MLESSDFARLAKQMLACRSCPAFLIEADGAVVAMNEPADRLVEDGRAVRLARDGRLTLTQAARVKELESKLQRLCSADYRGPTPLALRAECDDGEEAASVLLLLSRFGEVLGAVDGVALAKSPLVLVSVQEPTAQFEVPSELLIEAFGFTPQEARLANGLVGGDTVGAFAKSHGIKITTARWHLRNALEKSGCNSQRELVRRLIALIAL